MYLYKLIRPQDARPAKFIWNSQWGIVLRKERPKISKTIEEKE